MYITCMYMIVLISYYYLAINNIDKITLLSSLVYELLCQLQSSKLCMELKHYIVILKVLRQGEAHGQEIKPLLV